MGTSATESGQQRKKKRKESTNGAKDTNRKGKLKSKEKKGTEADAPGGRGGAGDRHRGTGQGRRDVGSDAAQEDGAARKSGAAKQTRGSAKPERGPGHATQGIGQSKDAIKPRRPLAELVDYLRSCWQLSRGGLEGTEQEAAVASRAVEEVGDRVLMVAADQRGSKMLERLLRQADTEAFAKVCSALLPALPELAPNQYASHVLESVFASWTSRLGSEDESKRPPVEPVVTLCQALKRDGGWPALVVDSCASHVVRALILALGGYVPTSQDKGRTVAREGFLPETQHSVPAEVVACRHELAGEIVAMVKKDMQLCMVTHASPVLQLLLRVLRSRGDRGLVGQACAAITGMSTPGRPSIEQLDALAQSPSGSRALEAVLETASAEAFSGLFTSYFRPRLRGLSSGQAGEFGAYLVQRVVNGLADEAQLASTLDEVDFAACLTPKVTAPQQATVVKVLEACLRVHSCLKRAAGQVFRTLGLHESAQHHRVWPSLLALEEVGSPAELLRASSDQSPPKLRPLPSAGAQIITTLLRFPKETVQPLNAGLSQLLEQQVLIALACEARTARVLETALAPSSALENKLRMKLTRSFKGLLAQLGPHPVGGWVCAAVWRCSLGSESLRKVFLEELLAVEEQLRAQNFAVWKVCGLNQAKVHADEWQQQQTKAGKAKRLFDDLLQGGDPEAAKAAAEARRRAEEDRANREAEMLKDPLIAALLPAPEVKEPAVAAPVELDDGGKPLVLGRKGKKRTAGEINDKPGKTRLVADAADATAAENATPKAMDASLRETLDLIASRAPTRLARKRRKKATAAENKEVAAAGEKKATAAENKKVTAAGKKKATAALKAAKS